ncbi:MAG: glycoside hydrolase family 2 TIM barrel-domain containing protein [Novosphingobium sp.]
MPRSKTVLSAVSVIAALGIPAAATAQAPIAAIAAAPTAGARTEPRLVRSLADGWRFKQDNALVGAEAPGFDDAAWQRVSVPHTWNRVGHYIPDPASHLNTARNIDKTMGIGWYRLTFTPGAEFKRKRAWLEFDAASRVAEVWLNGVKLGSHAGGFSRFRLDATAALRPGAANVLVVKADNSAPAGERATLPLAGDFFVHGGLYRPARLIATDDVHVEMLDHGGPGVYASTRSVEGGTATIAVRALLRNDGKRAARAAALIKLVDATGTTVAEKPIRLALPAGRTTTIEQDLSVPGAHLWHGVDDPYLYRLVVELQAGKARDRVDQAFGIRQIRIDPEKGFFLNGKPYRLRGVGIHQDLEGKGWAMGEADFAADVAMIRELGANSLRLTHYQWGPAIHELADRTGLVLWDEIPLVTLFAQGKGGRSYVRENALQQMRELIRQNYNHPSVAVWGIANEVDFGSSMPSFLGDAGGSSPLPLLRELNALAKAEDPSRPTTQANCCEGRLFAANVETPIVAPEADLSGVNRYFGWYYGAPADLGPHLDALRADRPGQPLSVSEYGAGGSLTIHTDDPAGGLPDSRGRRQPEEYMSYIHEDAWPTLAAKPYLWGTWLWNGNDFATTVRREGDANDINTKGLVTYDRKTRKDAFYYYKANWNPAPTVHINGRRYVDRAYRVNDLRVYSNAPETELTLNGRSLGTKADCAFKVCVWPAVKLDIGENALVATGRFAGGAQQDRIVLQAAPRTATEVRIDSGALVAGSGGAFRFGSDTFFTGGKPGTVAQAAQYGKAEVAKAIAGTEHSEVASTFREGAFRYRIPLADGAYTVTLTFIEPKAKPGERRFDVLAGGKAVVRDLDVVAAAGAPLTAITRSFPVTVGGGGLDLEFRPSAGQAIVSSIEVVKR